MLSIIISLSLMGQVREDFSVLHVTTVNRIENTSVGLKVSAKAKELAEKYSNNENSIKMRMIRNRLIDYIYTLPNFHGPISDEEDKSIDSIVDSVIPDIRVRKMREVTINGKKVKIFSWLEQDNPNLYFLFLEQPVDVQNLVIHCPGLTTDLHTGIASIPKGTK